MSNELEKLSTAALCDEIEGLDRAASNRWTQGNGSHEHDRCDTYHVLVPSPFRGFNVLAKFDGDNAYASDVTLAIRYRALAPEAARRLRERDDELKAIAAALDLGPGEVIDGEILEAIEALQEEARRAKELESRLSLLKCDHGRAAGGAS
jgi:hypothetical protein